MLSKHSRAPASHQRASGPSGRWCPPRAPQAAAQVVLSPIEQVQQSICPEGVILTKWIVNHGGFIHPHLAVVPSTPLSGCRGVLAIQPITEDELRQVPLIAVPEKLYITTEAARALLARSGGNNSYLQLSGVVQLALLLAHERNKGQSSFWWPYINALPPSPPSAWFSGRTTSGDDLRALGPIAARWEQEVAITRQRMERQADKAVQLYGQQLGVTRQEVLWAMAQVLSRAFGSDADLGLAPYIDMCNHQLGCATPDCWEDEELGPVAFISSLKDGAPAPLQAGDELFVSYLSKCTALSSWLNFGFVPTDLTHTIANN